MPNNQSKTLSWRDPDGFVLRLNGRILRAVAPDKADQMRALLAAPWMQARMAKGTVAQTVEIADREVIDKAPAGWMWLEHTRLRFPCYPHEATALQLYDSALLTLELGLEGAENGWTLKDASAWNVLHSEGRPVFVDLLSFDRALPSGMWRAYGQFVRHFVLPLLLYRKLGLTPPELFLSHRDGVTPERAYDLLRGSRLLSSTALEHILLPKWLAPAGGRLIAAQTSKKARPAMNSEIAAAMPAHTLRRLRRTTEKLLPDEAKSASVWKRYEEERLHYSDADIAAKTEFVADHLSNSRSVLDLGCNAGEFSLLAANAGATVVAGDSDHAALSRLYGRIRELAPRITPLLVNIGRPTPAIGWANDEVESFLTRSSGQFDCILALGLLHHLLVSERATLAMIVQLLVSIRPERILLEWIDPMDPKFKQLAGFDASLYAGLTSAGLEALFTGHFDLKAKLLLPCNTRVMYLWVASHIRDEDAAALPAGA